jgi:hypothetical protein
MVDMLRPITADIRTMTIMRQYIQHITATAIAEQFVLRSLTVVPDIMAAGIMGGIVIGNIEGWSVTNPAMAPAVAGFYLSYPDPAHARGLSCLSVSAGYSHIRSSFAYCAVAQSRFEQCNDFASERQFLLDYVEKIVTGMSIHVGSSQPARA